MNPNEFSVTNFPQGLAINSQHVLLGDNTVANTLTLPMAALVDYHPEAVRAPYRKGEFYFTREVSGTADTVVDVNGVTVATFTSVATAVNSYVVTVEIILDTVARVICTCEEISAGLGLPERGLLEYDMTAPQTTALAAGNFDIVVTNVKMNDALPKYCFSLAG